MKKKILLMTLLCLLALNLQAQRQTDRVDRGLIAVKTSAGAFCSWRILGEEYYDVTYNIYRDGTKLNAEPLTVSNYTDAGGTTTSKYAVEAIVRGVAQAKSAEVQPMANNYLEIVPKHQAKNGTFIPNDATAADLDGDGQLELIVKYDHATTGDGIYTIIEALKLDGTLLWWINCGRNMGDFQNNEINIACYDWDLDGKAECIMRAADGTVIYKADGTTQTIGNASKNYRPTESGQWFVHEGAEYLLYLNGETAEPYQVMDYPLKRLEAGESNLEAAWGDGYGHRSSKYFFGAPYFDGHRPSIFLARGIYTRHKMIAYDVDPSSHALTVRWQWSNNTPGIWYGQGYHNYVVADVDMDGRDEIVFGSMTIDDNGKGLASSGLGHGDAQHVSDFDPYRPGLEFFGANEDHPGNNFCDATTRKILYRYSASSDDGRAIMGNFSNDFPGCQGSSARDPNLISSVTYAGLSGGTKNDIAQNMRIYWDGDLCEETFNYANGHDTEGVILKYGKGVIATFTGSMTNNYTKGTPCLQADIFGDWREEVVMRTADNNIRIYTTTSPTPWRNYTLWHDHQYRNAIVWQMNGYNQPPHASYFLGELEGITMAPPPLTTVGRTVVANGETIGSALDDKHLLLDENNDMTVTISEGAKPYILTDNAPSWTQGSGNNANIKTSYYTHTLTGGSLTGEMRLVKQGEGTLVLPAVTHSYTGKTMVWNGTLVCDGTLTNSPVWLNRHTTLISNGGKFEKGIQANYNATIIPGGNNVKGSITTDTLALNFGSTVSFDLFSEDMSADLLNANVLKIEKNTWREGPSNKTPIFKLTGHAADGSSKIAEGKYLIGTIGKIEGNLEDIVLMGFSDMKSSLSWEDGKLYVSISAYQAGKVVWTGQAGTTWNTDETANFKAEGSEEARNFFPDDEVIFDDSAAETMIIVSGKVAPKSIVFANNSKNFTLLGDSIVGQPSLSIEGSGKVTVNNINRIENTTLQSGKLSVTKLANTIGTDYGALGGVSSKINISNNATLQVTNDVTTSQTITIGSGGGTIEVNSGKTLTMSTGIKSGATGSVLTKTGAGSLTLGSGNNISKLVIKSGAVNAIVSDGINQLPSTVVFEGGTLYDSNSEYMPGNTNSANYVVEEGQSGTLYCDPRCDYTGKLTGAGTFTVYAAGVRNYFKGNWSSFEGTLVPGLSKRGSYDPSFDWSNTYGLPNATLKLNSGVIFKNGGKDVVLGGVSGTGTLEGTGSYYVGDKNDDFIFTPYANSKIVKRGEGTMKIMSLGRINAAVEVRAGCLTFNQSSLSTAVTGTNTLTVKGTGKVMGQGLVNAITVASGGQLLPRGTYMENIPGTIKTTGVLTSSSGSTIDLLITNSKNSQLQTKYLTLNGTLKISLSEDFVPTAGATYTLWTTSASFAGTPTLSLPELPEGFAWDTSELLSSTGILKISNTNAINGIAESEEVTCKVYSLTGQHIGTFKSMKSDIKTHLRAMGTYGKTLLIKMQTATKTEVRKVNW